MRIHNALPIFCVHPEMLALAPDGRTQLSRLQMQVFTRPVLSSRVAKPWTALYNFHPKVVWKVSNITTELLYGHELGAENTTSQFVTLDQYRKQMGVLYMRSQPTSIPGRATLAFRSIE